MSEAPILQPEAEAPEHVDVLIVGAGISGVGGAVHLKTQLPEKSFLMLENQNGFGGTWRTHTYPGIRSDSDLYTFGYRFKPWTGAPIATAEAILDYMGEVIDEHDLDPHIRYGHTVLNASWCSDDGLWTLLVRDNDERRDVHVHLPLPVDVPGLLPALRGLHPRVAGYGPLPGQRSCTRRPGPKTSTTKARKVLVIGSGATAATLVPAMADKTAHITMLQRSPTYFFPGENRNEMADMLRELDLPEAWMHEIVRRKILHDAKEITRKSFEEPETLKQELLAGARAYLGEDFDIEAHFTPRYRPWQQRLAFIPDGDLFRGIAEGKASVVTDEIETFNETGRAHHGPAGSSTPTSSSPPPASTCACSATSTSRWTARPWTSPTRSPGGA